MRRREGQRGFFPKWVKCVKNRRCVYVYVRTTLTRLRGGEGRVIPILGDASEEVEKLEGAAYRVLMPLPEQEHEA